MHDTTDTGVPRKGSAALAASSVLLGVFVLTYAHYLPGSLVRFGAAGVLAAAAVLAVLAFPRWGLLLALFYIYANLTFIFKFSLSHPVVLIVAVSALLSLARGDTLRVRNRVFNVSVAVFTMLALQSMLFAHDFGYSMIALSQFAKVLVMACLVVQLLRTHEDLDRFALAVFLGSVASIVLGTYALFSTGGADASVLGEAGVIRFSGTRTNPNSAALYTITTLPLGVYLFLRYRGILSRIAVGLGLALLLAAVIFSFSRQGIFTLCFVVVAVIVREARRRGVFVATFLAVVLLVLLTPSIYWERLVSIGALIEGTSGDWSFYLRITALKNAWGLFLAHPFTGVGLNNFIARSASELFIRIPVHNTYLEILVGVGIPGLLAFLGIHYAGIRGHIRALRVTRGCAPAMNRLAYYFLVMQLAALVGAMFQSIPFYYLIWLPLAAGLAVEQAAPGAGRPARP